MKKLAIRFLLHGIAIGAAVVGSTHRLEQGDLRGGVIMGFLVCGWLYQVVRTWRQLPK